MSDVERVSRHWHRRFLFAHSGLYRWWKLESTLARRWRDARCRRAHARLIASMQRFAAVCDETAATLRRSA
jgi:hypothetical protein